MTPDWIDVFLQTVFTPSINGEIIHLSKVKTHALYLRWCKERKVTAYRRLSEFGAAIAKYGIVEAQVMVGNDIIDVYSTKVFALHPDNDWDFNIITKLNVFGYDPEPEGIVEPAKPFIINWVRANANAETFKIKPIRELVLRYVGDGKGWCDPYAGNNSPCEFTNDMNPACKATFHLEADAFCKQMPPGLNGVIIDPPYSRRQTKEHYNFLGMEPTQQDTQNWFYNRVMDAICDKVRPGGYAIVCGWNSAGLGKNRGFERIEMLVVCTGQYPRKDVFVTVEQKDLPEENHDTIVLVERKVVP